jgi:hypothetical protein
VELGRTRVVLMMIVPVSTALCGSGGRHVADPCTAVRLFGMRRTVLAVHSFEVSLLNLMMSVLIVLVLGSLSVRL